MESALERILTDAEVERRLVARLVMQADVAAVQGHGIDCHLVHFKPHLNQ